MSLVLIFFLRAKFGKKESVAQPSYSPTRPDLYVKSEKSKFDIQEEVIFWENVIEKQPNSRDALVNLSILKKILGENEESSRLWEKARLIDPNNPIFTD